MGKSKTYFIILNHIFSFLSVNRLLTLISLSVGAYILFILSFNVERGFNITDESQAIIWATSPESLYSAVSSYGFYTRLLYFISGENIPFFRLLGIFTLLVTSFFFTKELYQYILNLGKKTFSIEEFVLFSLPIMIATLGYYRMWILVPTVNWLTLVSVLIFTIGLLRRVNECKTYKKWYWGWGNLLVAIGGTLTFLSKPTSAAVLVLLAIIWLFVHIKQIKWIDFLLSTLLYSVVLLNVHVLYFYGSYIHYYEKVLNGIFLIKVLGAGHVVSQLVENNILMMTGHIFQDFYFFKDGWFASLMVLLILLVVFFVIKKDLFKHQYISVKALVLISVVLYSYILYTQVLIPDRRYFWLSIFELLCLVGTFYFIVLYGCLNTKNSNLKDSRVIFLIFFFSLFPLAYVFGTNNNIIHKMSEGVLFTVTSLVILGYSIDNIFKRRIVLTFINVVISLFVLNVINYAFNHPVRVPGKISDQNTEVSLLVNDSELNSIKVDTKTANYINRLKAIALSNGWKKGKTLIDLTGGTPGASVVLGADFIGTPWLFGRHPGSEEFAYRILSAGDKETLEKAWILTAPKAKNRLSIDIIKKHGLNFPNQYSKVGEVKTGYRKEKQELWKPKF